MARRRDQPCEFERRAPQVAAVELDQFGSLSLVVRGRTSVRFGHSGQGLATAFGAAPRTFRRHRRRTCHSRDRLPSRASCRICILSGSRPPHQLRRWPGCQSALRVGVRRDELVPIATFPASRAQTDVAYRCRWTVRSQRPQHRVCRSSRTRNARSSRWQRLQTSRVDRLAALGASPICALEYSLQGGFNLMDCRGLGLLYNFESFLIFKFNGLVLGISRKRFVPFICRCIQLH